MSKSPSVSVVAIVPLDESGGAEVLVFQDAGTMRLPAGDVRAGERLLDAAVRVVSEQAGFRPVPLRVVYLLEAADGSLDFGVLCSLPELADEGGELRGEFAAPGRADEDFQPMALLEIMMEDLRSGFVRPVAHVIETWGDHGPVVHVSW